MLPPSPVTRYCLIFTFLCLLPTRAVAQIEMQADQEGVYQKVAAVGRFSFRVIDESGRKQRAIDITKVRYRPAPDYADGFVKVDFGEARDPRNLEKSRLKADKNSFEMEVGLTADRRLDGCFYILLFTSNGAMATYYDEIGALPKDKTKTLKITMPAKVDQIGSLHIFTNGDEVRTNDSVPGQSLEEEYQKLRKDSMGVPLTELFRQTRFYPHRLSASGRYLATYRDEKAHNRLVVIDTESMEIVLSKEIGEFDEYVADPKWLDERTLLYVFDEKLHSIDIQTGRTRNLQVGATSILWTIDADRAVALHRKDRYWNPYYRRDPRIRDRNYAVVNCRTGEIEWLEVVDSKDWNFVDKNGRHRFKRELDRDRYKFFIRPTGDASWTRLDAINNELGLIFDYTAEQDVGQPTHVGAFDMGLNRMLIFSERGRNTVGLYLYDLEKGRIESAILEDDEYDVGGDSYLDTDFFYSRSDELAGVGYWRDFYTVKWFDPAFQEMHDSISAALGGAQLRPQSWSDDGSVYVVQAFHDQDPGSYYIYRAKQKSLLKLYEMLPALNNYELGETRSLAITARDGTSIHCYLTLPPNWDGKALPLVADIHGGPMVRDTYEFSPFNQFWSTRGFAVLQVNYRGSIGFGRKYRLDALIGNLDTYPIDDIADCVRSLVEDGVADPEKIAITGASWGGYSVYMSLARYPELYRCGVAAMAPSNVEAMIDRDLQVQNFYGRDVWRYLVYLAVDDVGYADRLSPINYVDKIARPVLILHGEHDYRVGKDQATRMATALERAGKEHTLVIYPDEGHGHTAFGWNHHLNQAHEYIVKHLGL